MEKRGIKFKNNSIQNRGEKMGNNTIEQYPNVCDNNKSVFVYKPNNRQYTQQGGVSSSSRIARLKQLTKNNYNIRGYSAKTGGTYSDPHKDIKKKRFMNCSKTDIHYRNGNKTRCFKTISHNTKHDQKKRLRQKEKRKNYFVNYYEIKEGIVDCSSEYITTSDTDDDGKTYNSSFDCKVEIIGLYKDLYFRY